jgi:hypothetical protein
LELLKEIGYGAIYRRQKSKARIQPADLIPLH